MQNLQGDIKDALTCFICAQKIKDPLMCTRCRKMMCTNCIKKWLDKDHKKCPFCQNETSLDKMVPLPFMNQLSDFFVKEIDIKEKEEEKKKNEEQMDVIIDDENDNLDNKIKNIDYMKSKPQINFNAYNNNINNDKILDELRKEGNLCEKHNEKIEYFCLTCGTKHCSKCLIILNKEHEVHSGHKIIDIEQRKKFKIDDVNADINNFSKTIDEINRYQISISNEIKIRKKKCEFYDRIFEEMKRLYNNKIEKMNDDLYMKLTSIHNRTEEIKNIKENNEESMDNYIHQNDLEGFNEYHQNIKNLQILDDFRPPDNLEFEFKPKIKFFETDFMDIEIDLNKDLMGEHACKLEGFEPEIKIKFQKQAEDEVLASIFIEMDNPDENRERYDGYLITKNKDFISAGVLEEKMYIDKNLILGRTLLRKSFFTLVDENYQSHVKLIFAHCSF